MCDLGIKPENFNPYILYTFKERYNIKSKSDFHSHDFIELKYILSGSSSYSIEGKLYGVKKGDIIICNPGAVHKKVISEGEEFIEFNAGFTDIAIKNYPDNYLLKEGACPVISLEKYQADFMRLCSETMAEQEKREPGYDLVIKSNIMKMIVIVLKETYLREKRQAQSRISFESHEKSSIVSTVISFFNDNYMRQISLESISKNMYLSPAYISKVFKEETGDSPINYLISLRLSKAKELLKEGRTTIKEAAEAVGYIDVYHFSKLFKKHYGFPPSHVIRSR
ncbi:MAG: AraC family transcriptional regulator [Clostridia bacterium]|nr:AraC family transcriptional regulator [Clostridia bacterium]